MVSKHIKGKIFITSSLIGMFPLPFLGVYSSSKAAISQLVKTLQQEERVFRHNISFCLIEPWAYSTGFNQTMIDKSEAYQKFTKKIYLFININVNYLFYWNLKIYHNLQKK